MIFSSEYRVLSHEILKTCQSASASEFLAESGV